MHGESCGEGPEAYEGQDQKNSCQEAESGQTPQEGKEEEQQLSRHALHSTWELIYQKELEAAATRRAYAREQGRSPASNDGDASSRSSSISSRSSSDSLSIEGDEWFGPECSKIANWVSNTLRKQQNNPLRPYFHGLHSKEPNRDGIRQDERCELCMQKGPWTAQQYLSLPVLDVGCGGGQFLARLQRCGFLRLAGIDYSASAILLAETNLHSKSRKGEGSCHICLRQADLRELQPDMGRFTEQGATPCLCCCSKACEVPKAPIAFDGKASPEAAAGVSSCGCEPLQKLPPFPVIFDKGTFDVFWLMRTPEVYVQCMHRLMPRYGILFLTSCNCTVEELDSFFCSETGSKQQRLTVATAASGAGALSVNDTSDQQSSCERAGAICTLTKGLASLAVGSTALANHCEPGSPGSNRAFERIDLLPHRSFKFGGVEGQVVTSVLLRRL